MKKVSFLMFLLTCLVVSTYAVDLKYGGDPVTKRLKLDVNQAAVESNAFIQWELQGDWDKFDYSFSQGVEEGNTFTIYAKDYLKAVNGEEGVLLTISGKKKTSKGDYNLNMVVVKATDNLSVNKDKMNLSLPIQYEPYHKTIFEILLPFIILLIVILLIILILHVTAKFPKGLLQLNNTTVKLKGKKMVSVKDELQKMGIFLAEGTDIILVKKRFASFQGPCVKLATNCNLMCNGAPLTKGKIMRRNQEVKGLVDKSGTPISMRYV